MIFLDWLSHNFTDSYYFAVLSLFNVFKFLILIWFWFRFFIGFAFIWLNNPSNCSFSRFNQLCTTVSELFHFVVTRYDTLQIHPFEEQLFPFKNFFEILYQNWIDLQVFSFSVQVTDAIFLVQEKFLFFLITAIENFRVVNNQLFGKHHRYLTKSKQCCTHKFFLFLFWFIFTFCLSVIYF